MNYPYCTSELDDRFVGLEFTACFCAFNHLGRTSVRHAPSGIGPLPLTVTMRIGGCSQVVTIASVSQHRSYTSSKALAGASQPNAGRHQASRRANVNLRG